MLERMELQDRVGLSESSRRGVERAIAGLGCLADVIRWGVRTVPERLVVDVVVQDEYTHDVILDYGDGLYLVFDTT